MSYFGVNEDEAPTRVRQDLARMEYEQELQAIRNWLTKLEGLFAKVEDDSGTTLHSACVFTTSLKNLQKYVDVCLKRLHQP